MRRLSRLEYVNSLRALLAEYGLERELDASRELLAQLPPDGENSHLFSEMDARTSARHVDAFYAVADDLATRLSRAPTLTRIAGECAAQSPVERACIQSFVDRFGRLAARRTLSAEQSRRAMELYDGSLTGAEIVRRLVFTFLLSPEFLYHLELEGLESSTSPRALELDGPALAQRLSFHFLRQPPSSAVLDAAEAGQLSTNAGYEALVDELFERSENRALVSRFFHEWFQLDGFAGFADTRAFQAFAAGTTPNGELYADMLKEVDALIHRFTFESAGTYADLLTTRLSLTSSSGLASLYGVAPWSGAGQPPSFAAEQRAGLLTRAALLVEGNEMTNPIKRGAFILKHVLCVPLEPPSNLPAEALALPPANAAQTTRTRFQNKTAPRECAGCHELINPLGFALEAYDALGRFRTEEQLFDDAGRAQATLPVDAHVTLSLGGTRAEVSSPVAFSDALAQSAEAAACFARQYFRFSVRRDEGALDACTIARVQQSLRTGGLKAAFRSLVFSEAFKHRVIEAP